MIICSFLLGVSYQSFLPNCSSMDFVGSSAVRSMKPLQGNIYNLCIYTCATIETFGVSVGMSSFNQFCNENHKNQTHLNAFINAKNPTRKHFVGHEFTSTSAPHRGFPQLPLASKESCVEPEPCQGLAPPPSLRPI